MSFAVLAVLAALAFSALPGARPALASPERGDLDLAFSKDAYWYGPGDTMKLKVTADNHTRRVMRGVSIRVRLHAANAGRRDLDDCLDGKPQGSYRQTDTYGPFNLSSGNNVFVLEQELKSSRYRSGVYPMTIELLRSDDVLASAGSQAVVMSLDGATDFEPLQLAWVFDTLDLPHRDPGGVFTSDRLAHECDGTEKNRGWYPALLSGMEKYQDMNFSLVLSPMLIEDMSLMTTGYTVSGPGGAKRVGPDSPQAQDASVVLSGLGRLAQSGRYQLVPAPYASPDLEKMVAFGWARDARRQIARGREVLEEALDAPLSDDCVCPPAGSISTPAVKALDKEIGGRLLLSPALLERSREGRRLLARETSLCSPVKVSGGRDGSERLALFSDARMGRLLEVLHDSGDPHGVAQCVISELTNLYLEYPAQARSCTVVWPGSWHPSADVLDELLKALDSAPWLQAVTVDQAMEAVKPAAGEPLVIPDARENADPGEYEREVERARSRYDDYRAAVLPGNDNLSPLLAALYVSQSDVWRQREMMEAGREYSGHVTDTVANEFSKVQMPAVGNITLTSTSARIPMSVINETGYRVRARLSCESNGLSFPDGPSKEVLLEPKENLLEVPVQVRTKGRVRFSARLLSERVTLSALDFTVLTSRFNSFAVVLVSGLLGLIGLFWGWKAFSRRKVGKHKRRQVRRAGKETGEAAV